MEESSVSLNAKIRAVEHQRDLALSQWALDRAALLIANGAIVEQDAKIAQLEAEVATLRETAPKGAEG